MSEEISNDELCERMALLIVGNSETAELIAIVRKRIKEQEQFLADAYQCINRCLTALEMFKIKYEAMTK